MSSGTMLVLRDLPWPPFSGRDVNQVLKILDFGELRRSVNGDLRHLGAGIEKFSMEIKGGDVNLPCFDGVFKGQVTEVESLTELVALVPAGDVLVTLGRDAVDGAVRILTADGDEVSLGGIIGRDVSIAVQAVDVFVFYRPLLVMLVKDWNVERCDVSGACSWVLELVEK